LARQTGICPVLRGFPVLLHQIFTKKTTNPSGLAARFRINLQYPPALSIQKRNPALFVVCNCFLIKEDYEDYLKGNNQSKDPRFGPQV